MKIILLRHCESLSRKQAKVEHDAERPLSETGRRQGKFIAKTINNLGISPEAIFCSPFVRTQQSAQIIGYTLKRQQTPIPVSLLAPGSGLSDLLAVCRNYHENYKEDWMIAILHEPDVSFILGTSLCSGAEYPVPVHEGDMFAIDVNSEQEPGKMLFSFSTSQMLVEEPEK